MGLNYNGYSDEQKLFMDFNIYGCCFTEKETGKWIDATKVRVDKDGNYLFLNIDNTITKINVYAEYR